MSAGQPAAPQGRSRRSWGWHPLTDEWATRIVAAAGVRPGELVLDIGAGTGALTAPLVRAGARVLAVELHPGRAARLATRFADDPVTVLQIDARALRLPGRPFRVVASPPYAIGSALLRLLLARGSRLVAADLVLQRAVVRRWAAADPHDLATRRDAVSSRRDVEGRGAAASRLTAEGGRAAVSSRRDVEGRHVAEGRRAVEGRRDAASSRSASGRQFGGTPVNGRWTATVGQRLPRSAFRVPPQVDSDVLVIRRR